MAVPGWQSCPSSSIQRHARGCVLLPAEPEPCWQRDGPGAPKSRCPRLGGHLPWRFPFLIIKLSKPKTENCLADEAALPGARESRR